MHAVKNDTQVYYNGFEFCVDEGGSEVTVH